MVRKGSFTLICSPVLSGGSHDPQRPLTHDRLLYVTQRLFGRITSMPGDRPIPVGRDGEMPPPNRLFEQPITSFDVSSYISTIAIL